MFPLVAAVGACQPGWVRIDGGQVSSDQLQQASKTCQIEEKLATLERARKANSVEAAKASSNEGRMQQLDSFEFESYQIYVEIDECMQSLGYVRP